MEDSVKEISITKYLISKGFSLAVKKTHETWFLSPLRPTETKASFKVNEVSNLWYDFGAGEGGSILDLVMNIYSISIREAYLHLEPLLINRGFIKSIQPHAKNESKIKIVKSSCLSSKSLINYLTMTRGIKINQAIPYVKEVDYSVSGKGTFKAIGFSNDKGGHELRSEGYQLCSSPKFITTIQGKGSGVNIFEGFMDFLSALTFYNTDHLANTTIVLNSVHCLKYILNSLSKFKTINIFIDNDDTGIKATNEILGHYPDAINQSKVLFPDDNDFNDFLLRHQKEVKFLSKSN